ncbi:MAG: hypothetical protein RL136_1516 [Planctomycetota bacterium]
MLQNRMLIAAVTSATSIVLATNTLAGGGSFQLLGVTGLYPSDASTDGSVVVGYNTNEFWYWTSKQGMTFIGGLTPFAGGAGSAGISNDGGRIGYTILNPKTGKSEGAFFDVASGTTTNAGNFGFSCDLSATSCWGLSGDGNTMVGLGWHNGCAARAYRSNADGLVDLGTLVPGAPSRANACSEDGTIIAGWQDTAQGARQAAYWKNGVEKYIFTQTGQPLGEAGVVSNDGNWILGLGASTNGFLGWKWSETTGYIALPASPIPNYRAFPTAISDDGSRILLFYRTPAPPATGGEGYMVIDGTLKSLEVLAAENGIALTPDIHMALPLGMSGDGYTIVGTARTATGVQGFILDLPRPANCGADLNGDGLVGAPDVATLLDAWGKANSAADLDGDGLVGAADLAAMLDAWGACP